MRHPHVAPPVGEQVPIVESEDVDVCPVHEVVRQDTNIAPYVVWSNDAHARWIVAFQCRDKHFRPTTRQHASVVVDPVEVVDVIEVGYQHRVVLSPGRFPGVVAFYQGQVGSDAAVLANSGRCCGVELEMERVTQPLIGEHFVITVVRQVKPVDVMRTGRIAERWHKRFKELKLFSNVVVGDIVELVRRYCTPDSDQRPRLC